MSIRSFKTSLLFLVFLGISACVNTAVTRIQSANHIAHDAYFSKQDINANGFTLRSYARMAGSGTSANIYIEGDGFAWAGRSRPSTNPTPKDPTGLKLATMDPAENVIYLARPCQYMLVTACQQKYWTSHRFAPEVVEAMDDTLDKLKTEHSLSGFHLIGFSGGANVAALITARRNDVISLRTIAGNLDHVTLHQHHNVSQTPQSLNAVNIAAQIAHIPQHHFIGAKDNIVPPQVLKSYMDASGKAQCIQTTTVPNATHQKGWHKIWPALLNQLPKCKTALTD